MIASYFSVIDFSLALSGRLVYHFPLFAATGTLRIEDDDSVQRIAAGKKKAKILQRFFKTGPGKYTEGDVFVGVKVPDLRRLSKKYDGLSIKEIKQLLGSPIHEERLLALFPLVRVYAEGDNVTKKQIYDLYLKSTRHINNWDLVEGSAEHIAGDYLDTRDREDPCARQRGLDPQGGWLDAQRGWQPSQRYLNDTM
jgi:hypothetical protein